MTRDEIFSCISEIIGDQISMDAPKSKSDKLLDLGVDSIGLMALIVYLEEKLEIQVSIEEIADLDSYGEGVTIDNIIDVVQKSLDDSK
ncbi:MAG: acyl carrier protein [Clostridiales bacterium]|nr:acyl carrier protein [Clostridiales bacterium]